MTKKTVRKSARKSGTTTSSGKKKVAQKVDKKVTNKKKVVSAKSSKKKTVSKKEALPSKSKLSPKAKVAAPKNKTAMDPSKTRSGAAKIGSASPKMEKPVKPVKKKRMTKAEAVAQENLNQMVKKWQSLHKKSVAKGVKPQAYNMRKSYDAKTSIQHKVLGWGYIVSNVNNRLEVLFEDGVKYLISNYK